MSEFVKNQENFAKLKDYISKREWKSENWFDFSDCFIGMVSDITTGRRDNPSVSGDHVEDFLGISSCWARGALIGMANYSGGPHYDEGAPTYRQFRDLSLEDQNVMLLRVLDGLYTTGTVRWA